MRRNRTGTSTIYAPLPISETSGRHATRDTMSAVGTPPQQRCAARPRFPALALRTARAHRTSSRCHVSQSVPRFDVICGRPCVGTADEPRRAALGVTPGSTNQRAAKFTARRHSELVPRDSALGTDDRTSACRAFRSLKSEASHDAPILHIVRRFGTSSLGSSNRRTGSGTRTKLRGLPPVRSTASSIASTKCEGALGELSSYRTRVDRISASASGAERD